MPDKRIIKGRPFGVGFDRSHHGLQKGAPSLQRSGQHREKWRIDSLPQYAASMVCQCPIIAVTGDGVQKQLVRLSDYTGVGLC